MKVDLNKVDELLNNSNLSEVAKAVGIPYRTLQAWKRGENKWWDDTQSKLTALQNYINTEGNKVENITLHFKTRISGGEYRYSDIVEVTATWGENVFKEIFIQLYSEMKSRDEWIFYKYDFEKTMEKAQKYYGKPIEEFNDLEATALISEVIGYVEVSEWLGYYIVKDDVIYRLGSSETNEDIFTFKDDDGNKINLPL